MTQQHKALLMVVSAPSGAGKSTLCNRLMESYPSMMFSISCTTRAPRGEEQNGVHYHFLTKEEFEQKIAAGDFLEYAEVHGNYYGTLKASVEEALGAGRDLIMDIDVQGADQIRTACAGLPKTDPVRRGFVDLFICPPSIEELRRRLCGRGTDDQDVIEKRMQKAGHEMDQKDAYRHIVINDDLETALKELIAVVELERNADQ